jgi:hypothetical protein
MPFTELEAAARLAIAVLVADIKANPGKYVRLRIF